MLDTERQLGIGNISEPQMTFIGVGLLGRT